MTTTRAPSAKPTLIRGTRRTRTILVGTRQIVLRLAAPICDGRAAIELTVQDDHALASVRLGAGTLRILAHTLVEELAAWGMPFTLDPADRVYAHEQPPPPRSDVDDADDGRPRRPGVPPASWVASQRQGGTR